MTAQPPVGHFRAWRDEFSALYSLIGTLESADWDRPTPSVPWTIRHQVGHLLWTEEALRLAWLNDGRFEDLKSAVTRDMHSAVDDAAFEVGGMPLNKLLDQWQSCHHELGDLLAGADLDQRVSWFGPPMRLASALSARVMEIFAHGQDIRDALGLPPEPTLRLWHVADLTYRARKFNFHNHGLEVPTTPVRLELAHRGQQWRWGPETSADLVAADALNFALLACQRRNAADLSVETQGDGAKKWLSIVQAFAGGPGPGRSPLGAG